MNTATTPRACWSVLANKAQDQVQKCLADLAQSRSRVEQLTASHQRVSAMYEEYRQRERSIRQADDGLLSQANQRQFMSQILALAERVRTDLEKAQAVMDNEQKQLQAAELELRKMKSLEEQDREKARKSGERREQRVMDALGVAQFNLRRGESIT